MPNVNPTGKNTFHRFLDETGNTVFFGRGDKLLVGNNGVSLSFGIGLTKFNGSLKVIRQEVRDLELSIEKDELLNCIPSVQKRIQKGGFFFHASEDPPEVRSIFLRYLKKLDCESEVVIARKIPGVFINRHGKKQNSFYADLLSHLIKNRMKREGKLVLCIAERGSSTREKTLFQALDMARSRAQKKWQNVTIKAEVVFNIQTPRTEPLLNVGDYLAWAVQRVFEKGEMRYYNYLKDRIRLVIDLYDFNKYEGSGNYYDPKINPLTSENKISPPIT